MVCTDLICTGGFATLVLKSWKATVRDDPALLFAPYPSLALLYFNSAKSGLSAAHKFRLILFVVVGTDLHASCFHIYRVRALEMS